MATTPTAPRTYYWVVCRDYAAGPASTPEAAQRRLEGVERLGACREDHEVVPGDRDGPRHAWKKEVT